MMIMMSVCPLFLEVSPYLWCKEILLIDFRLLFTSAIIHDVLYVLGPIAIDMISQATK